MQNSYHHPRTYSTFNLQTCIKTGFTANQISKRYDKAINDNKFTRMCKQNNYLLFEDYL